MWSTWRSGTDLASVLLLWPRVCVHCNHITCGIVFLANFLFVVFCTHSGMRSRRLFGCACIRVKRAVAKSCPWGLRTIRFSPVPPETREL